MKKTEPYPSSSEVINIELNFNSSAWTDFAHLFDFNLSDYIHFISYITLDYINLVQQFEEINISLLLTDDAEIQKLNNDFRNKNHPTNVLSFPAIEINPYNKEDLIKIYGTKIFLGDIALSYQSIHQESIEQMKTFKEHFTHLIIHSILHLLGYDHIQNSDAEKMESLEIAIMNLLGFQDPYNSSPLTDAAQIQY